MPQDLRVPMTPILEAFGVPVIVTRAFRGDDVDVAQPVHTIGVWVTPLSDDFGGPVLQRRDAKRLLSFETARVPGLTTKTRIDAPEIAGGPIKHWVVDGIDRTNADETRVTVVEVLEN